MAFCRSCRAAVLPGSPRSRLTQCSVPGTAGCSSSEACCHLPPGCRGGQFGGHFLCCALTASAAGPQGQIPSGVREEQLWALFGPFGTVRNLHLLKGFDSKPRGCAMVLFARWAQAEAAADALNGKAGQLLGQTRPLVVHFANPRRSPQGPPEPGIAPRKLFIGQVPRDVDEETLRPLFMPYGKIEHISILRTQRGQSAGCAFVQFSSWAEAENAIDAHNGKTRLPGSDVPMVVKFADAKRRDMGQGPSRSALDQWTAGMRRQPPDLADLAGLGFHPALAGLSRGPAGLPGTDAFGKPVMGNGVLHSNGVMGNGTHEVPDYGYSQLPNPMMNEHLLLNQLNNLNLGMPGGATGQGYMMPGHEQQQSAGATAGIQAPNYSEMMFLQPPPPLQGLRTPQGGMSQALQGQPPLPDALFRSNGNLLGGLQDTPPAWGQRIGSQDRHNDWKLFVGQVPLEATERDLEEIFAPNGEIVELYILRNNNGKSRGCAFVTYRDRAMAQQAITSLNGRHVPPNKALVVKLADRSGAGGKSGMPPPQPPNLYAG